LGDPLCGVLSDLMYIAKSLSQLYGELQENDNEKRVKALKGFSQLSSEGEVVAASNDL